MKNVDPTYNAILEHVATVVDGITNGGPAFDAKLLNLISKYASAAYDEGYDNGLGRERELRFREGYRKGYEEGYDDGKIDGLAEAFEERRRELL